MDKKPEISIIVPVYNEEKYLPECLDSILAQTFTDFEVIAVDDGSPDRCGEILDQYAAKDARIKPIHQDNGGEAVARNRGLEAAQGEFIYFVDNDDYIHPQTLEVLYQTIQKSGLDGVACRHNEVHVRYEPMPADIDMEKLEYRIIENPLQYFLDDRRAIAIAPWCKLYRKSKIGQIRFVPGIHFDDVPFNIMMLAQNDKLALVDQRLYYFFQNSHSVSHTNINKKKTANYITIIRSIYEFFKARGDNQLLAEVQKKCLPAYVNTVIGGVMKMRRQDPKAYQEMLPVLKNGIRGVLADGIIKYSDFKWRKKWAIFKLVHWG